MINFGLVSQKCSKMLTQTYYYPTLEDKKGSRSAGLRLGEAFQKTLIG